MRPSQQSKRVSPTRNLMMCCTLWPAISQETSFCFTYWIPLWLTGSFTLYSDFPLCYLFSKSGHLYTFYKHSHIIIMESFNTRALRDSRSNLAKAPSPESMCLVFSSWTRIRWTHQFFSSSLLRYSNRNCFSISFHTAIQKFGFIHYKMMP